MFFDIMSLINNQNNLNFTYKLIKDIKWRKSDILTLQIKKKKEVQ